MKKLLYWKMYKLFLLIIIELLFCKHLFSNDENNYKINKFEQNKIQSQNYNKPRLISYFGSNFDDKVTFSIIDKEGNIVFVGFTTGTVPTTTNAIQTTNAGKIDLFLGRMTKDGKLLWCTMFGGTGVEYPQDLKIDTDNNIWIVGETGSPDFPTANNGNYKFDTMVDCFISKFSINGNLIYSALFGGNDYEAFLQLAFDSEGRAYAVGRTNSYNFPVSIDAKQKTNESGNHSGMLVRIDKNYQVYSSYIGLKFGEPFLFVEAIAIDSQDNIIIGGFTNHTNYVTYNSKLKTSHSGGIWDVFIRKYDKHFNLLWDAIYGGIGIDRLSNIRIDKKDEIIVLCFTTSSDLIVAGPNSRNYQDQVDAYVMKLNTDGSINWATYLGGNFNEGRQTNINDTDRFLSDLYVTDELVGINFGTNSTNMPTTNNSFMPNNFSNLYKSYSAIFDISSGALLYSTYFGGSDNEYSNSIYVTDKELLICGSSNSNDLPITPNAYKNSRIGKSEGFIALFELGDDPSKKGSPMVLNIVDDPCGFFKIYTIVDTNAANSNLQYSVIEDYNCSLNIEKKKNTIIIKITIIDANIKGKYKIEVVNSFDQKLVIEGELEGYLSNSEINVLPKDELEFPDVNFPSIVCKKIIINNTKDKEIKLNNIKLMQNISFSIPQSQFPIIIPPNSSVNVEICFAPTKPIFKIYYDTLSIEPYCIEIILKGKLIPTNLTSNSRCDVPIVFTFDTLWSNKQPTSSVKVTQNFTNQTIEIRANNDSISKVELFDILGNDYSNNIPVFDNYNFFEFYYSNLSLGTYFIIFYTKNQVIIEKFLIF